MRASRVPSRVAASIAGSASANWPCLKSVQTRASQVCMSRRVSRASRPFAGTVHYWLRRRSEAVLFKRHLKVISEPKALAWRGNARRSGVEVLAQLLPPIFASYDLGTDSNQGYADYSSSTKGISASGSACERFNLTAFDKAIVITGSVKLSFRGRARVVRAVSLRYFFPQKGRVNHGTR